MAKVNNIKWLAIGAGALVLLSLVNRTRVMNDFKRIRLGENFLLSEFVTTGTGLDNIPGEQEIENLRLLVQNILQPLRNYLMSIYGPDVAIIITSGYRSLIVNKAIGGSSTSQHVKGEAADFHVLVNGLRLTNAQVIEAIRKIKLPYDQVIDEQLKGKMWVHVSYSKTRTRKEWLTARDGANGGTVYKKVLVG